VNTAFGKQSPKKQSPKKQPYVGIKRVADDLLKSGISFLTTKWPGEE